jgi:predicted nucleic acid-binding Zn ribbon protein
MVAVRGGALTVVTGAVNGSRHCGACFNRPRHCLHRIEEIEEIDILNINRRRKRMNSIFYIIGVIVVVGVVLKFIGVY